MEHVVTWPEVVLGIAFILGVVIYVRGWPEIDIHRHYHNHKKKEEEK